MVRGVGHGQFHVTGAWSEAEVPADAEPVPGSPAPDAAKRRGLTNAVALAVPAPYHVGSPEREAALSALPDHPTVADVPPRAWAALVRSGAPSRLRTLPRWNTLAPEGSPETVRKREDRADPGAPISATVPTGSAVDPRSPAELEARGRDPPGPANSPPAPLSPPTTLRRAVRPPFRVTFAWAEAPPRTTLDRTPPEPQRAPASEIPPPVVVVPIAPVPQSDRPSAPELPAPAPEPLVPVAPESPVEPTLPVPEVPAPATVPPLPLMPAAPEEPHLAVPELPEPAPIPTAPLIPLSPAGLGLPSGPSVPEPPSVLPLAEPAEVPEPGPSAGTLAPVSASTPAEAPPAPSPPSLHSREPGAAPGPTVRASRVSPHDELAYEGVLPSFLWTRLETPQPDGPATAPTAPEPPRAAPPLSPTIAVPHLPEPVPATEAAPTEAERTLVNLIARMWLLRNARIAAGGATVGAPAPPSISGPRSVTVPAGPSSPPVLARLPEPEGGRPVGGLATFVVEVADSVRPPPTPPATALPPGTPTPLPARPYHCRHRDAAPRRISRDACRQPRVGR